MGYMGKYYKPFLKVKMKIPKILLALCTLVRFPFKKVKMKTENEEIVIVFISMSFCLVPRKMIFNLFLEKILP